MPDKYTAVWVSHTSISDFLACPRSYYLRHVYKDPKTNHKVKIITPALALGQVVHAVLEGLSVLPKTERFSESLIIKLDREWEKISGKKGGFFSASIEHDYKVRAQDMLRRVMADPGPLLNSAVKIQEKIPQFWLSEPENIILCGKIDWLEYLPNNDSVHIIDFKTGQADEKDDSLQLPIYNLLVKNCQERTVAKASYWYLTREQGMVEQPLPDLTAAADKVLKIAREMKLARQLAKFSCPKGENGCYSCQPFEAIIKGQAEFTGNDDFNYDVYAWDKDSAPAGPKSVIL